MNRERTPLETIEVFRNRLAFFLVAAFVAVLPLLTFKTLPDPSKDIITYMVGQLSGMATMALGFYFTNKIGQDALDAQKADNTAKMADAVVAAAQAGSAPVAEAVTEAAQDVANEAQAKADEIAQGEKK